MRAVPAAVVPALDFIVRGLRSGSLRGETLCAGAAEYTQRTLYVTSDAHLSEHAAAVAFRLGTSVTVRVELPDCVGEDVVVLELLAVVAAVRRWGPYLRGFQLVCGCDNSIVTDWVATGGTDRPDVRALLGALYRAEAKYDLRVVVTWLPRWYNYYCDRVAGLPTRGEVLAFAPETIIERQTGSPVDVLSEMQRIDC